MTNEQAFSGSVVGSSSDTGQDTSAGKEASGGEAAMDSQDRDYEAEAREMGWVPQDKFREAPEKWVDAKDFVDRGEHILPILRANNKKFREELLTKDRDLATLRKTVEAQERTLKTIQKHYADSTAKEIEAARKEIIEKLKEAKQIGDVDSEIELTDQLHAIKTLPKEPEKEDEPSAGSNLDPQFVEWQKENSWFGDTEDKDNKKRTKQLVRIAEDLRDEGETITGKAFMDKCLKILEDRGKGTSVSKVEGNVRSGSSVGGPKSYASLPKEAKDACMEDVNKFVGPGKMFKDVKGWQDHFASIYFSE